MYHKLPRFPCSDVMSLRHQPVAFVVPDGRLDVVCNTTLASCPGKGPAGAAFCDHVVSLAVDLSSAPQQSEHRHARRQTLGHGPAAPQQNARLPALTHDGLASRLSGATGSRPNSDLLIWKGLLIPPGRT